MSIPNAPSNLIVGGTDPRRRPHDAKFTLSWQDNDAGNEDGFNVYRHRVGEGFSLLTTVASGVTSYIDTAVDGAHAYYYQVTSFNDEGESALSNIVGPVALGPQPT